jgi:hypothetical protein
MSPALLVVMCHPSATSRPLIPVASARSHRRPHRRFQRRINISELGAQECEHVICGRAQCARTSECRQVPICDWLQRLTMNNRESDFHLRRQGDLGAGHPERRSDPLTDNGFVAYTRPPCENVPQQSSAEIRVFVLSTNVAGESEAAFCPATANMAVLASSPCTSKPVERRGITRRPVHSQVQYWAVAGPCLFQIKGRTILRCVPSPGGLVIVYLHVPPVP